VKQITVVFYPDGECSSEWTRHDPIMTDAEMAIAASKRRPGVARVFRGVPYDVNTFRDNHSSRIRFGVDDETGVDES
jgi:hypothetical protein